MIENEAVEHREGSPPLELVVDAKPSVARWLWDLGRYSRKELEKHGR